MLAELEAEETLAAIEVASMPHYKPEAQTAVIRRLQRVLAGPQAAGRSAHEALMGAGIPVTEVPKRAVKKR